LEELIYFTSRFLEQPLIHIIDILLVGLVIYGIFAIVRGTRAVQLLRGTVVIVLFAVLISVVFVELTAFRWLIANIVPALLVAFPVLFHAELRRAIEQADLAGIFLRFFRHTPENKFVLALARACLRLSQRRHGALIVIEREVGLQEYIDTGIILNAEPSPELLLTIFNKNTELHDGGVIFRGEFIAAAACVLPLSTRSLSDRQMGLRHRAALGISEVSDAVIVIVSEETGQVSIAHNGRILRRQDPSRLDVILQAFLQNRSTKVSRGERTSS
jgi:diadenylate cyclase